ncbi:ComEC/Rec2 family competence protein [Granulicoccus sp. GXG6511]|uniref:ComEC/Rec2 family competence protein n=1 Tax=Granulicoccus sp. GXG6511 TaxID=3381351 RepID=UPI003D7EDC49
MGVDLGRDLRLVPLAVAAWAAAWAGMSGALSATVGILCVGGLGFSVALIRRSALIGGVALTLVVVGGLATVRHQQHADSPLAQLTTEGAIVDVDFIVKGDPRVREHSRFGGRTVTAVVDVVLVEGRGIAYAGRQQAHITSSGDNGAALAELIAGTTARASARLSPTNSGPSIAFASLRSPPVVVRPAGPAAVAVETVRGGLRAAVADLPVDQRALVPALVVGDVSLQTPDLTDDFRTTGLTHLTAVSGANLTLLLAFLLTVARWVGVRGRWLHLVGLGGVVVFIALCRTEPSVLRASAMGLVALAALGGHAQPGKGARHLCVAVIVLVLIDPWLGRSVGFALSVLASAGIIGWSALWRDRMTWLPRPVAEAVTVPLAAQLATQPVVTAISGEVSVVGLVTNALSGPFVGPATVLGFATAGLSVVWPAAAEFTGWLAGWCAQGIISIARAGAAFPGAAWRWPTTTVGLVVVAMGCAAGFLLGGRLLAARWPSLVATAVMVAMVARPQLVPGWPPDAWLVVACDVGQGSATVLRAGEGAAVVVDTGPDPAAMGRCLDQLGVRSVPLLVLTHYHADHIDGRSAVFGRRQVGLVLVSPLASPAVTAEGVRKEAAGLGVPVATTWPGQQLQVGDVRWRTLGPVSVPRVVAATEGESAAENDASIVAIAEVRGLRVLLTGDVEPTGQRALLRAGADLRADVFTVPHHGSGRQDEGFFRAAGPGVALISAGENNDYGHPAAKTLRLLEQSGHQTLRTDLQGSLAVGGTRERPALTTQR